MLPALVIVLVTPLIVASYFDIDAPLFPVAALIVTKRLDKFCTRY